MQRRDKNKLRRMRGFERASGLVTGQVRGASESRGFAVSRLLTHWAEVVGPEIALKSRPVNVSYGRGFGATLTLLTTGAEAPMLEMQKDVIRDRVNACYGYKAIHKIRITQTAATGFAEGRAQFDPAPKQDKAVPDTPVAAKKAAENVADDDLRLALERLGANVLSQTKQ
ncbi:MAG: DUF721 domain-containing protein [Silicimonas sp.]|nr:DUF721 domain-containing protein [Silicimonas sp.]